MPSKFHIVRISVFFTRDNWAGLIYDTFFPFTVKQRKTCEVRRISFFLSIIRVLLSLNLFQIQVHIIIPYWSKQ